MPKESSDSYDRVIAMAIAKDPRFKIAYLIPHKPQSLRHASAFGGYTDGVHAAAVPLLKAAALPADVRELNIEPATVLIHRLSGTVWPIVTPIETASLVAVMEFMQTPFLVLLTNSEDVANEVDCIIDRWATPVLHISSVKGVNRVAMDILSLTDISKYIHAVIGALSRRPQWREFVVFVQRELNRGPQTKSKLHPLKRGLHNVVAPNEIALEAYKWRLHKTNRISEPFAAVHDSQKYVKRICSSADAVAHERKRLLEEYSMRWIDNRFVLAIPSVTWDLRRNWKGLVRKAPEEFRPQVKATLRNVVHSATYFDYVETSEVNGSTVIHPAIAELMKIRAKDMRSFTATLTAMASASLCPVLRMEPRLNRSREVANQLAHCVRNAGQNFEAKASRMARILGASLRENIDPQFLLRIDAPEPIGRVEGVKIVGDVPLGFLEVNGVPLGLRYDCSHISPIPGNLSHQICTLPPIQVSLKSFNEVLVLRSFSSSDPIRSIFYDAVQLVQKGTVVKRVRFKFVDVFSVADLINALADYKGALVVFDCHGVYNGEFGIGTIVIGGKAVNVWELKRQCELPPIVMFSACDTQPIDGSHASVATGAFVLGARAVLGTYFPISAARAAIFNARLLLRLDGYMPAALSVRPILTWREVVSGLLRMSYTTEVIERLNKQGNLFLNENACRIIQTETTAAISARHADWHEVLLVQIAKACNLDVSQVSALINRWCGLTDAMKHIHLGAPVTCSAFSVQSFL